MALTLSPHGHHRLLSEIVEHAAQAIIGKTSPRTQRTSWRTPSVVQSHRALCAAQVALTRASPDDKPQLALDLDTARHKYTQEVHKAPSWRQLCHTLEEDAKTKSALPYQLLRAMEGRSVTRTTYAIYDTDKQRLVHNSMDRANCLVKHYAQAPH
eukprot:6167856-Amphidinium_carterae.1